ncbi:MAG TPA: hypothetical protein VL096_20580, partial [Pirellulaceae bacterium]|nr:hypothetical protein [Pirellulaceae bacterium]
MPNDTSDRNNAPDRNDDGVSCLCEGAIFDVTARHIVDDAIHSFWNVATLSESWRPTDPCLDT